MKLVKPIVDWDAPYSVVGEARMWVGFLTAIAANGFTAMKKALVSGQYRCAGCCFYGGASLSASHASLLQWLGEQTPSARSVIFLDVHTGLGPRGVDTLSSHQTKGPDQQADVMLEAIFGNASNGDVADRDFILDIAGSSGNLNGPAASQTPASRGARAPSRRASAGGTRPYHPTSPRTIRRRGRSAWRPGRSSRPRLAWSSPSPPPSSPSPSASFLSSFKMRIRSLVSPISSRRA